MSEIEKYYNGTMHVDFEEEDLISEIIEQHNEIERLNKLINYKGLEDIPQYIDDLEVDNKTLKQENKILNSIIKEVREYITSHREAVDEREHIIYFLKDDFDEEDILEILDKEN